MLSFVIPAHDEAPLIGAALAALHSAAAQAGAPYEVIVADDSSTDGTAAIARRAGARVVRTERRQIAVARNAGAALAQGDVLVFVDADTLVTGEAVRGALEAVRGGAVGGGTVVRFDEPMPRYARIMAATFLWIYSRLGLATGCFLFCRRDAFLAAGGFDECLFAGEEIALSRSLRKQGRFVILREPVVTSARKMRTYSGWEMFETFLRLGLAGPRALRDRSRLAMWYEPRRKDPAA